MLRLIVVRLLTLVPLMFVVASVVFFLVHLIPGDPARIMSGSQRVSEAQLANIRRQYHLDRPIHVQYGYWVRDLVQGDLGRSFRQRQEVLDMILNRLPLTLKLGLYSFALSLLIAVPLGILAAVKRNTWIDVGATTFALVGASSPVFFTGILLILLFSYRLGWLPSIGEGKGGLDELKHLFLPSFTLGISLASITTRLTRSAMIESLTQDYIETARAKGLSGSSVVFKHAFRNALIPIITVVGIQFGFLLVGTVLVEYTFGLGGLGSMLVNAVQIRDYPVVQGTTIFIAGAFILINLVVDVLYGVVDPRIRYGRRG